MDVNVLSLKFHNRLHAIKHFTIVSFNLLAKKRMLIKKFKNVMFLNLLVFSLLCMKQKMSFGNKIILMVFFLKASLCKKWKKKLDQMMLSHSELWSNPCKIRPFCAVMMHYSHLRPRDMRQPLTLFIMS